MPCARPNRKYHSHNENSMIYNHTQSFLFAEILKDPKSANYNSDNTQVITSSSTIQKSKKSQFRLHSSPNPKTSTLPQHPFRGRGQILLPIIRFYPPIIRLYPPIIRFYSPIICFYLLIIRFYPPQKRFYLIIGHKYLAFTAFTLSKSATAFLKTIFT